MAEDSFYGSDPFSSSPTSFYTAIERNSQLRAFGNQSMPVHQSSPSPSPEPDLAINYGARPVGPGFQAAAADLQLLLQPLHHITAMSQPVPDPDQAPLTSNENETANDATSRYSQSSVKHLTCFWWRSKGNCRFSDEDCLYAHFDTGHYTDPPRQLIPGEPALAGRKLDRAMRNLAIVQRSSASLSSMNESRRNSRSSTPGPDFSSPLQSPLQNLQSQSELGKLNSDNQFLKNIVEQSAKEKGVMISRIEDLQVENKAMKAELEGLRTAQEQLLVAREGLQNRIHELENQQGGVRGYNAPYGVIGMYGRTRMNSETRYLGGLLDE